MLGTNLLIELVEQFDCPIRERKPVRALNTCLVLCDLFLQNMHHQCGSIQKLMAAKRSWSEIRSRLASILKIPQ